MNTVKKSHKGRQGFTLVEVVIAAVLVGISVAGVWGLISWLMYATSTTSMHTQATYLAEQKIEEILATSGLNSGTDSTGAFVRVWTITPVDSSQTDVDVVITWGDVRGRTNNVRMHTALVNAVTSFTGVAFSDLFTGGPG